MSEQTPNSSEDLSGAEPSMEDILASIRKIISDDEPMAMESPEDVSAVNLVETPMGEELDDLMQGIHMDSNDLTSDAVLDAAVVQTESFAAEGESVDLNIDDVLAGLDEDILGLDPVEEPVVIAGSRLPDSAESDVFNIVETPAEAESLNIESLRPAPDAIESDGIIPDADEDILAFLDADIPLVSEPTAGLVDAAPVATTDVMPEHAGVSVDISESAHEAIGADDLEMDTLLDDILMMPPEADVQDEFLEAPIETGFATDPLSVDETADLDLVKSLMADLADDPDGLESDEDLEALLAIPEVEDEAEIEEQDVEPEAVAVSEPEEDILGDILNMTLEDELQGHPDDIEVEDLISLDEILEAEQDNIAENAVAVEEISVEVAPVEDISADDLPSLSEIAAAAEADAVAVETAKAPQAVAATAGLAAFAAGSAALGATTLGAASAEPEIETAEPSHESHPTQETSMPVQAVKSDAILDDVTETATAGAFAQLNQVVEDKAIFNERGPRIGDLVQEALRPMLKEWLDTNLKGIVERAVAKEVKRIASGK